MYVEHFVFALHVHAFAFALFAAMLILGTTPAEPLVGVLAIWLLVYLFLAMKRVYGQGVVRTGAKFFLLGVSYLLALTMGMTFTFVATLLLL